MAEQPKTIIVTGANKGIGFGVTRDIAGKSFKIIMACRSIERGNTAKNEILKIHPAAQLDVLELDLDSSASIDAFAAQVAKKYGKIDILLNNSGRATSSSKDEQEVIKEIFQLNFYKTVELSEKMLPLIRPSGKVIFVGSSIGRLNLIKSKSLLARYTNPNITKQELFQLADEFKGDVPAGTYEKLDYLTYAVSKININTYVKIFAKYPEIVKNQIQVYGCCPGWVRTDMGGPNAHRSLEEGVVCPVYLVDLPFKVNPEFQGKFFSDQKVLEF